MFERYSESARRMLFFARHEVSQLGATSIEPEHILLAILSGEARVAQILAAFHASPESLCREVESRCVLREKISTSVEIPFGAATEDVLRFAAEEADRLQQNVVGPEHLLLGLLRAETSMAGSILTANGLRLDEVRSHVASLRPEPHMAVVFTTELANPADAPAELRARAEAYDRCWVEGRLDDLRTFLDPDVVFTGPDFQRLAKGIDACVESYARFITAARIHDFKTSEYVVDITGTSAVMTYRWSIDYEWEGKRSVETGQDLLVWVPAPGGWLICWRCQRPDAPSVA
jgi:hypothetical protein